VPTSGPRTGGPDVHSGWAGLPVAQPNALIPDWVEGAVEHADPAPGPDDLVMVSFWTDRHHHLYLEVVDHGQWPPPGADPGYRGRGMLLKQRMVAGIR
jgi:hypothetical protein